MSPGASAHRSLLSTRPARSAPGLLPRRAARRRAGQRVRVALGVEGGEGLEETPGERDGTWSVS